MELGPLQLAGRATGAVGCRQSLRRPTPPPLPCLYAETSGHCLGNLPAAALLLLALWWLLVQADTARALARERLERARERRRADRGSGNGKDTAQGASFEVWGGGVSPSRPDRWRQLVGSPVVAHAWEAFCSSVVQEVGGGARARQEGNCAAVLGQVHVGTALAAICKRSGRPARAACLRATPLFNAGVEFNGGACTQREATRSLSPRSQFIYDTWYAALSPDKEFPAEVGRGSKRIGWLYKSA